MMNEKIRITYIIDRLRYFAGTEKHLYQLVSLINKKEFSVNIITFGCYDEMKKSFTDAGVNVDVINLDKIFSLKMIYDLKLLVALIKKYRPQVVQSFHFTADTIGVIAAKLARVPIIISSRRDMGDLKKKRQIYINRLVNPFINKFIAVCNRVKDGISKTEGIPTSKITTIYNGVDLGMYHTGEDIKTMSKQQLGIDKDSFVVGIACVFRPEKDVSLFFEAISMVKNSICNLVVLAVGTGPNIDDYKNYCKQVSLTEQVIFTGFVKDVRNYVQAMDVVCLTPRENEGLSNAILEEMAMGKPIIATDVGGNAELVTNRISGLIIQPGDRDALAKSILKLYKNSELSESMGCEGRKKVEQYFTTKVMLKTIEKYYKGLITSKISS